MTVRLAASNIAWTASEDAEVEGLLPLEGVRALEAAPTRLFGDTSPSSAEIAAVAARLDRAGLELVAFQSLLFATPGAALFGAAEGRRLFLDGLSRVIDLAGRLAVGRLVLGSPRNRLLAPGMTTPQALDVAVPVLAALGRRAEDAGTMLCIEPNPPVYGCDFITTPEQGATLVDLVGEAGFALHLDTAGTVLAGADPVEAIDSWGDRIRHVHISAPDLAELETSVVPHGAVAAALRRRRYEGAVSIEMRALGEGGNAARVLRAVRLARRQYAL